MPLRTEHITRSIFLLLAVVSLLAVTMIAVSPAHWHPGSMRGCDICAIAHLPVLQPPIAHHLQGPAVSSGHVFVDDSCPVLDLLAKVTLCLRGPPA